MGDISDGYEQRALDAIEAVERIEKRIKQGYKITKKEFLIHYGYEPYFGVFDTAPLVEHLEKYWSKDDLIHHMLKEYTPRNRGLLLAKVAKEREEAQHEHHRHQ
jgi:hypothetical protein